MPMYHPFLSFKKVVRLPEYEYIGLTEEELNIIDTFEFQRLRRIKQTPGAYLVYPGAAHTRFEHSLGVMYLAGEAACYALLNTYFTSSNSHYHFRPIYKISNLDDYISKYFNKIKIDTTDKYEFKDIIQKIRLAGLLHDIGHGPFSHVFELAHEIFDKEYNHEELGYEIIKYLLQDSIYKPQEIIKILKGNCKFLSDILVSDSYNFDRMNYLVLDSKRAGTVEYGIIDVSRVIQNLYIDDKDHLRISVKAKDAAIRTLEAYLLMYYNVYLHKKARGADIQVAHILGLADKNGLEILEPDVDKLLTLWDDGILYYILKNVNDKRVQELLKRYLKRDIFKCVYSTFDDRISRKIIRKGAEKISELIKNKAKLSNDKIVYIDITDIKPPAPIPSSEEAFKQIAFYNPNEKKSIELDSFTRDRLFSLLSRIRELRVYCFKEHEDLVSKASRIIFEGEDNITL